LRICQRHHARKPIDQRTDESGSDLTGAGAAATG